MGKRKSLTAAEKKLLAQFECLSETQPRYTPRPEQESVVAAIKRLNATYFMLEDHAGLLNEASVLMTQHVMQGRDINEVIDELETVFARFYGEWRSEMPS